MLTFKHNKLVNDLNLVDFNGILNEIFQIVNYNSLCQQHNYRSGYKFMTLPKYRSDFQSFPATNYLSSKLTISNETEYLCNMDKIEYTNKWIESCRAWPVKWMCENTTNYSLSINRLHRGLVWTRREKNPNRFNLVLMNGAWIGGSEGQSSDLQTIQHVYHRPTFYGPARTGSVCTYIIYI